MRRVALISEHASPLGALGGVDSGGQNVYVAQIATGLAARGWSVDVFTRRDAVGLPEIMDAAPHVRVIHVPAGPTNTVRKEDLLPYMTEFTDRVEAFCHRHGLYDLVHANFFMSALVAADLKVRTGMPFVVTFHALGKVRRMHQGEADGFPDERFQIEERVTAEAARVIAECPQDREDLLALYGADPARVDVVPCGFDPKELWPEDKTEARLRLGLDPAEPIVLQLGRMVPRKGVETVIRALAPLQERSGVRPRLLVVGGGSAIPDPRITPEIGRLQDVAREVGVEDLVSFAGSKSREELRDYYSAADAFVSVPWYEPFGITPLEAMACSTPVIGSAVGGIKYSVIDGETGFLVPPKDDAALADRLAAILLDKALAERMGRAGLRRVRRRFTWGEVTRNIERVYEDVLAQQRSSASRHERTIDRAIDAAVDALRASQRELTTQITEAAAIIGESIRRGGKILVCGNGGSAADAQHFTAELVCRFKRDRQGIPAMSLVTDSTVLTAWSNDIGFESVFARQVEAFGRPGDVLIGISTSGRSENVTRAFDAAGKAGMARIGFVGGDGGDLLERADLALVIPAKDTPRVQEVQMTLLHVLAELVEEVCEREDAAETTRKAEVVSVGSASRRRIALQAKSRDDSASSLPR